MTVKPNVGDKRTCDDCGGQEEFKLLRVPDAYAVGDGGAFPEPIPDFYGWECSECGRQIPFESQ